MATTNTVSTIDYSQHSKPMYRSIQKFAQKTGRVKLMCTVSGSNFTLVLPSMGEAIRYLQELRSDASKNVTNVILAEI